METNRRHILYGKKIILGVSGSIAAYKSAFLTRLLIKAGAEVKVVLTPDATEFVTPLTLATLSKNPVHSDFTEDPDQGTWSNHVDLGLWGDLLLIAPATANTLSKMVTGACDNFLMAVFLSARCEVMVAPAMDLDMFSHKSSQSNLVELKKRGVEIIEPEEGELASGLRGKGRMAEPENIFSALENHFLQKAPLHGKKVLITAGPTHEAIDAVRFIGNHSSGKMGFHLARRLAEAGAEVQLVAGPVSLDTPHPAISRTNVTSAAEMHKACLQFSTQSDIIVMAAAVADYRPSKPVDQKIKKSDNSLTIELEPTADILAELGKNKQPHQILIGFALETDNEIEHAKSKRERKNLDLIVLNSLNDTGAGFGHDTNRITLIDRQNKISNFELKSKSEVALDIVKKIIELCPTPVAH